MRLTATLLRTALLAAATGLLLMLSVAAQGPARQMAALPPELVASLARLRDAALASDYAWRQVAHLTENIGPRLAGSLQAEAAVNYVADELRRLGLEVRLQEVTVPHWVRGEEKAELTGYPGQAAGTVQKIVLTALGNSAATPAGGLTADVVDADAVANMESRQDQGHVNEA